MLSVFMLVTGFLNAQIVFVKHDATGSNDGSSWTNAYTNLPSAVTNAQAADELWIAAGTYKPGTSSSSYIDITTNIKLYGGFNGTETALSQRDWTTNQTVISGDLNDDDVLNDFTTNRTDNTKHLIWVNPGINNNTIIDGILFRNGHTSGASGSGDDRRGAAILSYGNPIIQNCQFEQNFGWFGALHPRNANASNTKVINCRFKDNYGGYGVGIYSIDNNGIQVIRTEFINNKSENFGGGIFFNGINGLIDSCFFTLNAGPTSGGGMALVDVTNVTVQNSLFDNNTATNSANNASGGAIYHGTSGGSSSATFINNQFINNNSDFAPAISNLGSSCTGTIESCLFENNNATRNGGALSCSFSSYTTINNSVFRNNEATRGGAIYSADNYSQVQIDSSLFEGNKTIGSNNPGGAIHVNGSTIMTITNSKFENNESNIGGAINVTENNVNNASLKVENTYFLSNFADIHGGALNITNAKLDLTSCVFSGNGGNAVQGGAIYIFATGGDNQNATLINNSFGGNLATKASSILHSADLISTSSMLVQNNIFGNDPMGAPNYETFLGTPVISSLGGNLSTDGSLSSVFTSPNDLNNTDPQFVDVLNNDLHLLASSPCINTGIDAGAPLTDIEHNPRIGTTDMGAHEGSIPIHNNNLDRNQLALKLFPNPAHNRLNVTYEGKVTGSTSYSIIGANGAVLLKQLVNNAIDQELQFDLQHLPNGFYELHMNNEHKQLVKSFVISK